VQVGSAASLTTPAYPGQTFHGRVTYIDPRVDAQTRTARVRVEVANPEGRLRLGMYVTLAFTTRRGAPTVSVPRIAIQTIGERHVVFVPVPGADSTFVPRTVQLGPSEGELATIRSGIEPGELVVTEGSFLLRAEMLRHASAG